MAEGNHNDSKDISSRRRLVLCFDGTGNQFSGDSSDTNVVKIYQMLDRNSPEQFHYYQPGIGTYAPGQSTSSSDGFFKKLKKLKSKISATFDQAVGTSFEAHVIAGYQFIMRYYSTGDAIYIFGFSRGAYTARFLAEMVQTIGLLSQGNEEMVHFAWTAFSVYQQARGRDPKTKEDEAHVRFMKDFKRTFCRDSPTQDSAIHFLGLFDCVNSVGQFEIPLFRKSYRYIATPSATHIRHAVSIHERRLKFKPALFIEEQRQAQSDTTKTVKEVWFAGNHGDVGGGWKKQPDQYRQLSDTPLAWMVAEVLDLNDEKNEKDKLAFQSKTYNHVERREATLEKLLQKPPLTNHQKRKLYMKPHDMLRFGGGATWFGTTCWWIIESLPFFTRLELENKEWVPRYWPPNMGASRDIPHDAVIHPTVEQMRQAGVLQANQMPQTGGDEGPPTFFVPALWGGDEEPPTRFVPARALAQWEKLRDSRATSKSQGKKPSSNNSSDTTPLLSSARSLEDSGHVVAKRWTWD